jgi:tetratricopeptide (TPR) repeat protein/CHAT domain-containing protein
MLPSRLQLCLIWFVLLVGCGAQSANCQSARNLEELNRQIDQLIDKGKYREAIPLAKKALELTRQQKGGTHVDTAWRMSRLARSYEQQGHYTEAEPLYREALSINEMAYGRGHDQVARCLSDLGLLYNNQGRHREAEALHKLALAIWERDRRPVHFYTAGGLMNLADAYRAQGHYQLAEPLYKRALATSEKLFGPKHTMTVTSLSNLASLYSLQGRYAEAATLFERALAIDETRLGPDHPEVATDLNNLSHVYIDQERFVEAEALHKRALAIRERMLGPDHPWTAVSLLGLSRVYRDLARYSEAEPLIKRALAIEEKNLGADRPKAALESLAALYQQQGLYAHAELLFERSLGVREKALGLDHPSVGAMLINLAGIYEAQGRYAKAEPLYHRALTIREKRLGPNHPAGADSLSSLASLYVKQGRYAEAEALFKRALVIYEEVFGRDHRFVGVTLSNLAGLYWVQERYDEAQPLYVSSLTIREKTLGPDHPSVANALNGLANLYWGLERYADAEPLQKRALGIREKALGPGHRAVAQSFNNLAEIDRAQGRYAEAEQLHTRALAIWKKALGPEHPDVGISLHNLSGVYFAQGQWEKAALYGREATHLIVGRLARSAQAPGPGLTGKGKSEIARENERFWRLVKILHRLANADATQAPELAREAFRLAQWAQASDAAVSLVQMAARTAKGDDALAQLVRERQDLVGEWQAKDKALALARSAPPKHRNGRAEAELSDRLAAIDVRVGAIDRELAKGFPEYRTLAAPEPVAMADVQALLQPDEALLLFLDTPERKPTPEETFIWAVTKTTMQWTKSDLGTAALKRKVAALRCGLDEEEWATASKAASCGQHLALSDLPEGSQPLPFDLGIAHELYRALIGPFEGLIKGKRLLIVPSGPLTSLPLHVLVTKPAFARPASFAGYRKVDWLAKSHALSVLPAVSSLQALRGHPTRGETIRDDYIGYGDPVLKGEGASCRTGKLPDKCPSPAGAKATSIASGDGRATIRGRGGRRSASLGEVFARGGVGAAVLEQVRALCPLPDTAYEIKCVAAHFRANATQIRLDRAAREADIKALSRSGTLERYRILHFATHGLLAGDVEVMASRQGEPALVLTPPDVSRDSDDDGLLTASEVAQLKLNADWVVLSACNTAASDQLGAEALSGLARAFFYAGARALLVSHWPVYSDAAVRLTTGAFAQLDRQRATGRAEALQRAMIELMDDTSQEDNAHPAVWAPFVVVGEGAR